MRATMLLIAVVLTCVGLMSCSDDESCAPVVPDPPGRCSIVTNPDEWPVLLSIPLPRYPREAIENGDEGIVQVIAGISTDGVVCGRRILTSDAVTLEGAALQSAVYSEWIPARRAGTPVAVEVVIPLRFSLNAGSPRCVVGPIEDAPDLR
ncbi:MAG: TonB family protein [Candidatus Eisenbacteria bacterium]|nr:TonB family protein [Candidatus Eisenbacteria bacterium]